MTTSSPGRHSLAQFKASWGRGCIYELPIKVRTAVRGGISMQFSLRYGKTKKGILVQCRVSVFGKTVNSLRNWSRTF